MQSSREAAQLAATGYDAMAGNDERNWIGAARATHGAERVGGADGRGNFRIASGLAARNLLQRPPNAPLKIRSAAQIERWKGTRLLSGKNGADRCRREFNPMVQLSRWPIG